ncbi:SRPBCC family protein [Streptomyces cinnabarinus]|uniref:SRPBCC family protein n=1 Tax=Streptomyces cinnabarinus TaxID=67287 RepID=A0ABY7KP23_9ACTN|nr:SRPBCC family protein [Streptomyces cinnabarinus]WAZ24649.1 SRPBCC family protein [Streptomyces cinnabarinus]
MSAPARTEVYEVEHRAEIAAPAAFVYRLLADVTHWPRLFPNIAHMERFSGDGTNERVGVWLTSGDRVFPWVALRVLRPGELRVDYRQETTQAPVADMGGSWIVEPLSERACRVRLLHDCRPASDEPATLEFIAGTLERNSTAELAAFKEAAEREAADERLVTEIEDTARVDGSVADVYEFLADAAAWPERIPHIVSVDAREGGDDVQLLDWVTHTERGVDHPSKVVRVCFPPDRIVYRHQLLPPLAAVHTGGYTVTADGDGAVVSSRHTVVLSASGIANVLGEGADVEQARAFTRQALSTSSREVLARAKEFAEHRRHGGG